MRVKLAQPFLKNRGEKLIHTWENFSHSKSCKLQQQNTLSRTPIRNPWLWSVWSKIMTSSLSFPMLLNAKSFWPNWRIFCKVIRRAWKRCHVSEIICSWTLRPRKNANSGKIHTYSDLPNNRPRCLSYMYLIYMFICFEKSWIDTWLLQAKFLQICFNAVVVQKFVFFEIIARYNLHRIRPRNTQPQATRT